MAKLKIESGNVKGEVSLSVEMEPGETAPPPPEGYQLLKPGEPAASGDIAYNFLGRQWERLRDDVIATVQAFGDAPWRHPPARRVEATPD